MPEVRRIAGLPDALADLERRLRVVEALAARAPDDNVGVELSGVFKTETSASFQPAVHSNLPAIYGPVLNVWVVVSTDASTVAELRCSEFYSSAVTDTIQVPGGTSSIFVGFEWLHGIHLADTQAEFRVDARRVSGAGNVRVFYPRRFLFSTQLRFPLANAAGRPHNP